MKFMRSLSFFLLIYWSGGVSALPLTYDFGFNGSVNGFSGTGFFTVSTLLGPPGLDAFSFAGTCDGVLCAFGLNDVSAIFGWNVQTSGVVSTLLIDAESFTFVSAITLQTGLRLTSQSLEVSCSKYGSVENQPYCWDGAEGLNRTESFVGRGAYLTLREEPPVDPPTVPVPSPLYLIGVGLAGLHHFRRIHKQPAHT